MYIKSKTLTAINVEKGCEVGIDIEYMKVDLELYTLFFKFLSI